MATIADLNVRIGTNIKGLESGLKSAESALRKSSDTLGGISSRLTNTLSLAFSALGGAALKSFGDIEKLQKGLESQLGSAEAAREEMDKIREAAKAPGLGFEQFVKGSLQLQAVGDNADKARKTISVFGNALANAGKGAAELDGVVTALTQIKSKGVVSAEEINQIAERLPQIRPAMQDAFGTSSTEAIQKLGITATEFIDGITSSLEKLPKASSSFSNDVTNAFDNVKQGAAKLGESINSNLRVGERLTALSEWAIGAADSFQNLDESTQQWIVGIGVVAVAIGPAIKAGSLLVQMGGAIGTTWTKMTIIAQQWAVAAANPEAKTGLIAWWKGLNTVMKANIIGITIGVVLALGAAFLLLSKDMSDAAVAQRSVNEVQRKAQESIVGQKSEVEGLVAAYKDEKATLDQKKGILNELKRISPEYFGTLKVGKGDVEALSAATAAYTAELLKVAKVTAAKDRVIEIERALLDLDKTAAPTFIQEVADGFLSAGNSVLFAAQSAKTFTKNYTEQKNTLIAERQALVGMVTQLALAEVSMKKTGDEAGGLTDKMKKLKEVLSDIENAPEAAKLVGDDQDIAKIKALEKGIKDLVDAGFRPASKEIQNLKAQLDSLTKQPKPINVDIIAKQGGGGISDFAGSTPIPQALPSAEGFKQSFEAALLPAEKMEQVLLRIAAGTVTLAEAIEEELKIKVESLNESFNGLGEGMRAAVDAAGPAFEGLASSILGLSGAYKNTGAAALAAASQIVKAALAATLAKAIQDSLTKSGHPLIGIALAGIAVGAVNALFGKINQSLSTTPKFAGGTQDAPGGLAIVGERGRELVNLPRHSQVIPNPQTNRILNGMGGRGGDVSINGEFTVRGSDLVAVFERANRKNQRSR